jgi:dihydroorotate dehydrogenase (fumarate)/dihydropyrimidine dehydrogenase (NAD+) subunit PreA
MADLSVEFAGIKFKNPVLLSSAEPTFNFEAMKKGIDKGIGGVVAKSFTDVAALQQMVNKPEMSLLDESHQVVRGKIPGMYTHISRTAFAKESMDEWMKIMEKSVSYARERDAVVIGSVAGGSLDSWVNISKRLEAAGVSMVELNFGCPHYGPAGDLGGPVGQNDKFAVELIRNIKKQVSVPIIVKETPQLSNMVSSVSKVNEAGADAVTLTNRFLGLTLDIEQGKPYIHGVGGCGGPWVKPFTLRAIHQVSTALGIPISGSNGATNWKDALEFMMVGASTVQFCTAVMVHGYELLPKIINGMSDYLDQKGYKTVQEIVGSASKHVLAYSEVAELPKERYQIDEENCIQCGDCVEACFYGAIQWENVCPQITDACMGCSFCSSICPESAITQYKKE